MAKVERARKRWIQKRGRTDLVLSLEKLVLELLDLGPEMSVLLVASCEKLLDGREVFSRVGSSSGRSCHHRDSEHAGSTRSDDDGTGRSESEGAHGVLSRGWREWWWFEGGKEEGRRNEGRPRKQRKKRDQSSRAEEFRSSET